MSIVAKDSKNRVSLGPKVSSDHFIREVDERGRIIFTPQVLVDKEVYDVSILKLSDEDRSRFVEALLQEPQRNSALTNALHRHDKKNKNK